MRRINVTYNKLNLCENDIEMCENIIFKYYDKMNEMYKNRVFTIEDKISFLQFLVDIIDSVPNTFEYLQIIDELFIEIKNYIEQNYTIIDNGLFTGLPYIGVIIRDYYNKTGRYGKFHNTIDNLIFTRNILYCENLFSFEKIRPYNYDIISGIAGVLSYMLDSSESKLRNESIEISCKYLCELILGSKDFKGINIPKWHIGVEEQNSEEEKILFPSGNLNFSLSHGICGVYYSLTKAMVNGFNDYNISSCIEYLKEVFIKFGNKDLETHIILWPGMLAIENYIKNTNYFINDRQSWCYGSIGISSCLMTLSLWLNDKKLFNLYKDNINTISQMDIYKYKLYSPIICHGYSGALYIFMKAFIYNKTPSLNKRCVELMHYLTIFFNEHSKFGFKDNSIKYNSDKIIVEYFDRSRLLDGSNGIILVLLSLLKKESILSYYLNC